MTSHLNSHGTTDIKLEMLSGVQYEDDLNNEDNLKKMKMT